jgi:hypothetical protein
VGTGGYGQDQELLALQEYSQKYRSDLVVLWQEPRNDVWNNLFRTHMYNRNFKPTFWLETGSLRGPTESLEQPIPLSPVVVGAMWQRIFTLPRRDQEWERNLPEPYSPLRHYDGPANSDWQKRWGRNQGRMRDENLATEKSHMAVMLTPRSKRTQAGLDLTRALLQRIRQVVVAKNGEFVILQVDDHYFESDEEQIYVLNGRYYRVSGRQFKANWAYVHQGLDTEIVPITVTDWRVGPEDAHYNDHATEQLMKDFAWRLKDRIPDKSAEQLDEWSSVAR